VPNTFLGNRKYVKEREQNCEGILKVNGGYVVDEKIISCVNCNKELSFDEAKGSYKQAYCKECYPKRREEKSKINKWYTNKFAKLSKTIQDECEGKVLDLGCGSGELTFLLNDCFGVDIKRFKEWDTNKELFSTKIPKERFDTILLNNSFEHIKNKTKVIEELKHYSPNAKVIVIVPTVWYLLKRYVQGIPRLITKNSPRVYFIHAENIYGLNLFKEFTYYLNWENHLTDFFNLESKEFFMRREQLFFIGSFFESKSKEWY